MLVEVVVLLSSQITIAPYLPLQSQNPPFLLDLTYQVALRPYGASH